MNESKLQEILKELDIDPGPDFYLSSLDLITAAVGIEKKLKIKFELNELTAENFASLSALTKLVQAKVR